MFKNNLRHLMAEKKIDNLSTVIRATGIARGTVNRLYREKNFTNLTLETLSTLCDFFNCKLSELIEYIPEGRERDHK